MNFAPWLVYAPDSNPAAAGVQLPTTVTITAGNDVSAAENDFTLLQNAVGAVADGQTLDLSGDFDWTRHRPLRRRRLRSQREHQRHR